MKVKKDLGKVELIKENFVAILTLSRPDSLNAITWEMYNELEKHLDELSTEDSIRAVIIRGEGEKALAAGTDISQFEGFKGEDGIEYEKRIDRIINKLETFPKPTIAAVKGIAVGGGLIIATACDLRYSTAKGKFGAPMAKTLGNCLSLENYKRLERELGRMRTKELLYTARIISSEEAEKIGFLTEIISEEYFFESVLDIAKKISEKAPLTLLATKKAFIEIDSYDSKQVTDQRFDEEVSKVYDSLDFSEGVDAYMNKRKPLWQGK